MMCRDDGLQRGVTNLKIIYLYVGNRRGPVHSRFPIWLVCISAPLDRQSLDHTHSDNCVVTKIIERAEMTATISGQVQE